MPVGSIIRCLWVLVALSVPLIAPAADDPFARALDERLPALLTKYRVPGAVISCINNGEVVWTKAFGLANLKTGAPMRTDKVFNHGSNGKVLTMWGIMRLVEQGKVELDAPANRYLKRWQIRSSQFNPDGVTIRRMLSHTAGLSVHGFLDYDQRRRLPSLVEILEGKNQIQILGNINGPVFIQWEPGSRESYSGGGFVIMQMIIEDVTGEPFATFMEREVTRPLGLNVKWVWTPELEQAAPMTYGELQEEIGYRQLGCQSIGSEICTVPDFARFIAAMATGPHGEPPGRGVLKPESIATMLAPLPGGIGYGFSVTNLQERGTPDDIRDDVMLSHSGANPGWYAYFLMDTTRRQGFVLANNSAWGGDLETAVQKIWLKTVLGVEAGPDPEPSKGMTPPLNRLTTKIAVALGALLFVATAWCIRQIVRGKRQKARLRARRLLLILALPVLTTLFWWYVFYAPRNLPLPFGPGIISIWNLPFIHYATALLLAWTCVALLFALFPRVRPR